MARAISSCTAKTSASSRSYVSAQSTAPSAALTSCAPTLSRLPDRRDAPLERPRRRRASRHGAHVEPLPLSANAEVRPATLSPGTLPSAPISSSVSPSEKARRPGRRSYSRTAARRRTGALPAASDRHLAADCPGRPARERCSADPGHDEHANMRSRPATNAMNAGCRRGADSLPVCVGPTGVPVGAAVAPSSRRSTASALCGAHGLLGEQLHDERDERGRRVGTSRAERRGRLAQVRRHERLRRACAEGCAPASIS